jgi:DNA-binding response OmpR family regulator
LILDWMMPGGDGTDVCRRLRKDGYSRAILMLTAKDTVEDRVEGLDAGADDYLVKPFELAELLARLRALTRRAYVPIVGDCVSLGSFELDRTNRVIRQREEEILLSPREFGLLDLLVQNKGQVLPRELILDRVWGYDADVSLKIVDATVKLLRKKLDVFGQQDVIQSIRGVGYKIED